MDRLHQLVRAVQDLRRRLRLIFTKATIEKSSRGKYDVKFAFGDSKRSLPVLLPYGVASAIPKDAKVVVASNGSRGSAIICGLEVDKKLNDGDVRIYAHDNEITLTRHGIELKLGSSSVSIGDLTSNLSELVSTLTKINSRFGWDTNPITLNSDLVSYFASLPKRGN